MNKKNEAEGLYLKAMKLLSIQRAVKWLSIIS